MVELAARFFLGGLIVSLFAACGKIFEPKTFAGMLGAAPSVALATLALTFANEGPSFAVAECSTMRLGAIGLVAYSVVCVRVVAAPAMPVWLGTGLCWLVWFCVSYGLWFVMHGGSGA